MWTLKNCILGISHLNKLNIAAHSFYLVKYIFSDFLFLFYMALFLYVFCLHGLIDKSALYNLMKHCHSVIQYSLILRFLFSILVCVNIDFPFFCFVFVSIFAINRISIFVFVCLHGLYTINYQTLASLNNILLYVSTTFLFWKCFKFSYSPLLTDHANKLR